MNTISRRRTASLSTEMDHSFLRQPTKKQKLNPVIPLSNTNTQITPTAAIPSPLPPTPLIDEVPLDIQPCSYLQGISFGELTQDFVSSTVPGVDLPANCFDTFFRDVNIDIVPMINESDISTQQNNNTIKTTTVTTNTINTNTITKENKQEKSDTLIPELPSSPLSSGGMSKPNDDNPVSLPSSSQKSIDGSQKRQADRAARNRESSRRAREKAKTKVKNLESDNMGLNEMVRRLQVENAHLLSQLERANVLQQSCTVCRYHAALSQQHQHQQVASQLGNSILR